MPAGESGGRRTFVIEFIGKDDGIVTALNNIVTQLKGLTKQSNATSGAITNLGASGVKNTQTLQTSHHRMSLSWARDVAIIVAAYVWVRNSLRGVVEEANELGRTIERSSALFTRADASARGLAFSYLKMGRDAQSFMQASILYERAGVRGENALKQLSVASWQLGVITGKSTKEVAQAMAELQMRTGMSVAQVQRLHDTAAMLTTQFNASYDAIMSAASAAPAAAQKFGLMDGQLMILGATFERMGMAGTKAGAMVGDIMERLADPTTQWQVAALAGSKAGERMKTDAAGVVADMAKTLQKQGDNQYYYLKRVLGFSEEETAAWMRLAKSPDEFTSKIKEMQAEQNRLFSTQKIFAAVTGDLYTQLHLLGEEIMSIAKRVGLVLAPAVSLVVRFLRVLVGIVRMIPTPILGIVGVFGIMALSALAVGAALAWVVKKVFNLGNIFLEAKAHLLGLAGGFKTTAKELWRYAEMKGGLAKGLRSYMADEIKFIALLWQERLEWVRTKIAMAFQSKALRDNIFAQRLLLHAHNATGVASRFLQGIQERGIRATVKDAAVKTLMAGATKSAALKTIYLAYAQGTLTASTIAGAAATGIASAAMTVFNLILSLNPIGIVVLLIVGLVAAMYGLYKMLTSTNPKIKAMGVILALAFLPLTTTIATLYVLYKVVAFVFGAIYDAIMETLAPIFTIADSLGKAVEPIFNLFKSSGDAGDGFFAKLAKGIKFVFLYFTPLGQFILGLRATFEILGAVVAGIFDGIYLALKPVIDAFSEVKKTFMEAIQPILDIFDSTASAGIDWGAMIQYVGSAVSVLTRYALAPLVWLLKAVAWYLNLVFESWKKSIPQVISWFKLFFKPVKDLWDTLVLIKKTLFGSSFLHIAEGIASIMSPINMLKQAFVAVKNVLSAIADMLKNSIFARVIGWLMGGGDKKTAIATATAVPAVASTAAALTAPEMPTTVTTAPPVISPLAAKAKAAVVSFEEREAPEVRTEAKPKGGRMPEIVVPVTLTLDGEVIASVVARSSAEKLVRFGNAPFSPMRGVPL